MKTFSTILTLGLICTATTGIAQINKTVTETDTGVTASITYNPMIPYAWETKTDDGGVIVHDGAIAGFELQQTKGPQMTKTQATKFVRDAVVAVCPSVDRAALAKSNLIVSGDGFYMTYLACPAEDRKNGN
ncbi:MAG: hypothetical protein VX874_20095 [Pseudomonadota bacterium]|nr:hypothetical protein [Pseudomonadota bacterium]